MKGDKTNALHGYAHGIFGFQRRLRDSGKLKKAQNYLSFGVDRVLQYVENSKAQVRSSLRHNISVGDVDFSYLRC